MSRQDLFIFATNVFLWKINKSISTLRTRLVIQFMANTTTWIALVASSLMHVVNIVLTKLQFVDKKKQTVEPWITFVLGFGIGWSWSNYYISLSRSKVIFKKKKSRSKDFIHSIYFDHGFKSSLCFEGCYKTLACNTYEVKILIRKTFATIFITGALN